MNNKYLYNNGNLITDNLEIIEYNDNAVKILYTKNSIEAIQDKIDENNSAIEENENYIKNNKLIRIIGVAMISIIISLIEIPALGIVMKLNGLCLETILLGAMAIGIPLLMYSIKTSEIKSLKKVVKKLELQNGVLNSDLALATEKLKELEAQEKSKNNEQEQIDRANQPIVIDNSKITDRINQIDRIANAYNYDNYVQRLNEIMPVTAGVIENNDELSIIKTMIESDTESKEKTGPSLVKRRKK